MSDERHRCPTCGQLARLSVWTAEKTRRLKQLWEANKRVPEIAAELGINENSVRGHAWKMGLRISKAERSRRQSQGLRAAYAANPFAWGDQSKKMSAKMKRYWSKRRDTQVSK